MCTINDPVSQINLKQGKYDAAIASSLLIFVAVRDGHQKCAIFRSAEQ